MDFLLTDNVIPLFKINKIFKENKFIASMGEIIRELDIWV